MSGKWLQLGVDGVAEEKQTSAICCGFLELKNNFKYFLQWLSFIVVYHSILVIV